MSRDYIETGVEWINSIPSNWKLLKVKNCFYISKEKAQAKNPTILKLARDAVKVRDISTNEGQIAASYDDYNPVFPGDFLLNPMDLYSGANCNVSEVEGVISPAYINLRKTRELNPKYFDYYFKVQYWTMAMFAHGKGVSFDNRWTLNAEGMKNYEIPFPNIDEQNKIVDVINNKCSQVDELIAIQEQEIEKLKAYKQSLITEVVTKGLNPNVEMKDSGIEWVGTVPAQWETITLKYCTYIRARLGWKGLKANEYVDEGYPLLSAFNIQNSKLVFDEVNYINQFRYDESPEIKLSENDILLVKDGAGIGKCAIVEELPVESTTNGSLAVITVLNKIVPKYLYFYFLSAYFQHYINRIKDGMGVPHLFQSDLREIKIVVPDKEKQIQAIYFLEEKCAQIDKLIEFKESKINKLLEYKISLIFEYVTGKKEIC